MNKKNSEFKAVPCNVILRCSLCGDEITLHSTSASCIWCGDKLYEVGVYGYIGHDCGDGRIGAYQFVGLEPIES